MATLSEKLFLNLKDASDMDDHHHMQIAWTWSAYEYCAMVGNSFKKKNEITNDFDIMPVPYKCAWYTPGGPF